MQGQRRAMLKQRDSTRVAVSTERDSLGDGDLELDLAPASEREPPTTLVKRVSAVAGGAGEAPRSSADERDVSSADRAQSQRVQRDLGRAMQSQKWPAVAPNGSTLEGGMACGLAPQPRERPSTAPSATRPATQQTY